MDDTPSSKGLGGRWSEGPEAGAFSDRLTDPRYEEELKKRRVLPEDRVGKLLAGRYKLLQIIGEGGMGTVYEAEHVELHSRFAIKLLSGRFGRDEDATLRFVREARAASAIDSEHIVRVFDVGEDPEAGLFMVMELLHGENLEKALESRGRLRAEEAAGIAWQVCLALDRAHGAGVVHRDLKPGNVFLARVDDGSTKVKVLDFGIAKLVRLAQETQGPITRGGAAIGTPQYMAPEQAQGLPSVDGRADIYALGALLFQCITGQPLYPALASYELTIFRILSTPPPRASSVLRNVDPALDALITSMTSRDPGQRPATADAVRARLTAMYPGIATRRLVPGPPTSSAEGAPARTPGAVTMETRPSAVKLLQTDASETKRAPMFAVAVAVTALAAGYVAVRAKRAADDSARAQAALAAASASAAATAKLDAGVDATATAAIPGPGALEDADAGPAADADALPDAGAVVDANAEPDATEPLTLTLPPTPIVSPLPHHPNDPALLLRDAQAALSRGDASRAESLAQAAVVAAPDRAEAWLVLAQAHEAEGRHGAAMNDYASCSRMAAGAHVDDCRALLDRAKQERGFRPRDPDQDPY